MPYRAPLRDMLFDLEHVAGLGEVSRLPGFEDAGIDTARAVLEECARFNEEVVAPLNRKGDEQPSTLSDGVVTTTPGFVQAFRQFAEEWRQNQPHRPSTEAKVRNHLEVHAYQHIGDRPMADLRPSHVQAMVAKLGQGGLGPRSVEGVYRTVASVCAAAASFESFFTFPARDGGRHRLQMKFACGS